MPDLILDLMGGDHAPHATLQGVIQALADLDRFQDTERVQIILVGDENLIHPLLGKRRYRALKQALDQGSRRKGAHLKLVHASESIEMDDTIRAIRRKPGASINIGCELAAARYRSTTEPSAAFVSAGHSGAVMASALLKMGRMKGVERPAIAVRLLSLSPDGCVLIDAGANVDCKPEHLRDFAVMGAVYAKVERKSPGLPRVGILSNGEESSKGNDLTREAAKLVRELPCFSEGPKAVGKFAGYSEGKEIFKGQVDAVVTDGFVGNVVLKSVEGLASAVLTLLKQESRRNLLNRVGFFLTASAFRRLKRKMDYAETGAAPLLGVAGYAFICHGRSHSRAIKNSLLGAHSALRRRLIETVEDTLKELTENPK